MAPEGSQRSTSCGREADSEWDAARVSSMVRREGLPTASIMSTAAPMVLMKLVSCAAKGSMQYRTPA